MAIQPITHQSWLFAPPLDMPLTLRLENGRFGSIRPRRLQTAAPCATVVPFATGLHLAVDLASSEGNCVFAANRGRVVEVETNPAATRGNVTIDHHPDGLGFVTKYNHVTGIQVGVGDFVQEGQPFAQVSAVPDEPHLHFELWTVVDRAGAGAPGDTDMAPIDPTRALYAWEQRLEPDEPLPGVQVPLAVGVTRIHSVPFFFARFESEITLHIPMYEPMTEDERVTIALLREPHRRGAGLELSFRHSTFWGVDVVTQAALTADS